MIQKKWRIKNQNPQQQKILSDSLGIDPIIAQLFINRDIEDIQEVKDFLSSDLSQLHDPFLLKNMDAVVKRIEEARDREERVLIFGDYDVDGVTSSVLIQKGLTLMGIDSINFIPHRENDGYGLNTTIGAYAKQKNVSVLIVLDSGTNAVHEVALLNDLGIDVIILDHHEPGDDSPPNALLINPKQKDCHYPFKYLATVGLAAKFIQALFGEISSELLDFTAIGTIADIVPLRGENRILVKSALSNISRTKNKGLRALLDIGKIKDKEIKPYHIGFVIGPRINSAGRMDSAHKSLDLFLSEDTEEANRLANGLNEFNIQRQKVQRNIVQEAIEQVEQEVNFKEHKVIVLSKEGWHKGIVGIVASKIVDKYNRPAIIIAVNEGLGTASARSIHGFHLNEVLSDCSEYLETFGGHKAAAGLTIKQENIAPFRDYINSIAQKDLDVEKLIPAISIDCDIPLFYINMDLVNSVNSMEPFGEGNPSPIFCSRGLTITGAAKVLGKNTLKFWVSDGNFSISAVGFGMGDYKDMVSQGQKIDIAYSVSIDDWNKAPTPQIMLKDIRLSQ